MSGWRRSLSVMLAAIVCAPAAFAETITLENTARPISALPLPAPLAAELESITIDSAIRMRDDRVYVRVALPFVVSARWRTRAFGLSEVECFARIQGAGPEIETSLGIIEAPEARDEIVDMSATIDIPRFTHVGDGTLTVGINVDHDGEKRPIALGAWKIHTIPIIVTSRHSADRLAAQFGDTFVDTRASFRLAPGARIAVPLPQDRIETQRIGIVSTLNYGNVDQGERVASITPVYADGSMGSPTYVEAGVHTALEQYDKLPPGTHRSKKINVFESRDSGDDLGWQLRPYQRHSYAATIDLPLTPEVERLEIRYERQEGTIDVEALVILE